MNSREHSVVWERVGDRMAEHAENKTLSRDSKCIMASLAVFALEVAKSYETQAGGLIP